MCYSNIIWRDLKLKTSTHAYYVAGVGYQWHIQVVTPNIVSGYATIVGYNHISYMNDQWLTDVDFNVNMNSIEKHGH